MSKEVNAWVNQFIRLLESKPESIKMYANDNSVPISNVHLSDNINIDVKFEAKSIRAAKLPNWNSQENSCFEAGGLRFNKIHPKLIDSYAELKKNKSFNENGYQLRVNKGSTILRIPTFDKRVEYFSNDYFIDSPEVLTSIIEISEKAKKGNLAQLCSLADRVDIQFQGSVKAHLKNESGNKSWKIGSQMYPVNKFTTIDEMQLFLFGEADADEIKLGYITLSQFQKLISNSHVNEISFSGPNDGHWTYNGVQSSLTYMVHNYSGESVYCVFHARSFKQARSVYEAITYKAVDKLLNELSVVSVVDGTLPISSNGSGKVELSLSSHPELRGLFNKNNNDDLVLNKAMYTSTISPKLENSDFHPLLENYDDFILAISPLCLKSLKGKLYLSDTYNIFEEQEISENEITSSIEIYLKKIASLPNDWCSIIAGDYLFNRRLDLASECGNDKVIKPNHLYKLAKKQASFSFMTAYMVNKLEDTFYLCEPFAQIEDREIFIGDLEKEISDMTSDLSEIESYYG